jgi:anti-sigma B factor antagonist
MPDNEYFRTDVDGVPVVNTPAEIDITTADHLRAVLLEAASGKEPVIVVNMGATRFCDSAGLHAMIRAHRRFAAEGRELRLVTAADGAVPRILALTGIDRYLRCFASLEQALTMPSGAAVPVGGVSGWKPGQSQVAS